MIVPHIKQATRPLAHAMNDHTHSLSAALPAQDEPSPSTAE